MLYYFIGTEGFGIFEGMKYFLLIIFFPSLFCFCQNDYLLDRITITNSTKLIGKCAPWDKEKTYKKLEFLIEDSAAIDSLSKLITYGTSQKAIFERYPFYIELIQNNKTINKWIICPQFSSVCCKSKFYQFNTKIIKQISRKYHLKYISEKKIFQNQQEFEACVESLKSNIKFIYSTEPEFKYEGTFEIEFPKNSQFPSPKVICEFLDPEILKIVSSKDAYRITFIATDYNIKNNNQFTMTIECNKIVYDKLKLNDLVNKNWKDNIPSATFYYRK